MQYGEEEGAGSPPCPVLLCFIQSGRRKTQLMFQVKQQQNCELESLLVQYEKEEGERTPPCPSPSPLDVLHSVWEKKDPANVPG